MSFSDHKITQFTHKITDLPDQPNLPADELKARFDSSPEELRQAVNGICDDADRLDDRVSGIIAETFGDAIPKSMLSDELQDEIDAKAEQTDLSDVDTRVQTLENFITQQYFYTFGYYTGSGSPHNDVQVATNTKAIFVHDVSSAEMFMAAVGIPSGYMRLNNDTLEIRDLSGNATGHQYIYLCLCRE